MINFPPKRFSFSFDGNVLRVSFVRCNQNLTLASRCRLILATILYLHLIMALRDLSDPQNESYRCAGNILLIDHHIPDSPHTSLVDNDVI